jgi:hypothetical protein
MLFQGYFFTCVNNRNPHHGGQVFIKPVSSKIFALDCLAFIFRKTLLGVVN